MRIPGNQGSRRWWRVAGIGLAVLVLLAGAAAWALALAFPPQRLSAMLSEQVRSATGRSFEIKGELSIRLWPTLSVVAHEMALENMSGGSRPTMATLRRAAFSVALQPLLQRRLRILRVDVEGADLLLETDASGRGNWVFDAARPAGDVTVGQPPEPLPQISLDQLALSDVHVTYKSGMTGAVRTLTVDTLTVDTEGERSRVSAALELNRQRFQISGTAGGFQALAAGVGDWPIDLRAQTDGANAAARGTIALGVDGGDLQLQLEARVDGQAALVALGDQAAAVPLPVTISASVTKRAQALGFSPVTLSVAEQVIEGRIDMTGTDQPRVTARLSSRRIDARRWQPARAASATTSPDGPPRPSSPSPLFSAAQLPWPALPQIPVTVDLSVQQLVLPGVPVLSELSLKLNLQPGRVVVSPVSFEIAQGRADATLEVRLPEGRAPGIALDLRAVGMSVPALAATAVPSGQLRGGTVDLRTRLSLTGATPRQLASSANGDVLLTVTKTTLAGNAAGLQRNVILALLQTVLPASGSDQPLDIDCAVVRLPLRSGIARIDRSIALETDRLAVAASGELNLAAQTLSLSFRPEAKKGLGLNAASLTQLVSLSGPLEAPRIGVDMKGSIRTAAGLGLAGATGGASLVLKRLSAAQGSSQTCREALGSPSAAVVQEPATVRGSDPKLPRPRTR